MYYEIVPMDRSHIPQIAALECRPVLYVVWGRPLPGTPSAPPPAMLDGWPCGF